MTQLPAAAELDDITPELAAALAALNRLCEAWDEYTAARSVAIRNPRSDTAASGRLRCARVAMTMLPKEVAPALELGRYNAAVLEAATMPTTALPMVDAAPTQEPTNGA